MSRTISVSDFLLISEFKGMRELDLIKPENDERVLFYLEQLGFDTDYTIYYKPNKHRNMRGEILVGYRIIGEINCNRKFFNQNLYTLEEIVAATSYTDLSLTRELCNLTGKDLDYKAFYDAGVMNEQSHKKLNDGEVMDDWRMIESQIVALEDVLTYVRGEQYKADGSIRGIGEK